MELTLSSAFSLGALVGHAAQILLVLSMLAHSMTTLRLLVILAATVDLAYKTIWVTDPVGVFWKSALIVVNLVQLVRIWHADRRASFSAEDRLLIGDRMPALAPGDARRFLDTGDWVDLRPGDRLTTEGARPAALYFLASGRAEVRRAGACLADCAPGSFVGEMALLEDAAPASATVVVSEAGRAWRVSYAKLERMRTAQPEAYGALGTALARDMRVKILRTNAARRTFP